MTDKEKLEKVFNELGIGFDQLLQDSLREGEYSTYFKHSHKKVFGYHNFYTIFVKTYYIWYHLIILFIPSSKLKFSHFISFFFKWPSQNQHQRLSCDAGMKEMDFFKSKLSVKELFRKYFICFVPYDLKILHQLNNKKNADKYLLEHFESYYSNISE